MTRAEFRKYLNDQFPAVPNMTSDPGYRKGDRNQYGPRKRSYGDYLWHQDRDMFEADYQEHLKKLK